MWALILCAASFAAPLPDRPMVTRTGELASPYTFELELGASFADGPTRAVPVALKYSIAGAVEPRVMANLAGVGAGAPGLEFGAKIRLFAPADGSNALAMWLSSSVPVDSLNEQWRGQWHALFTTRLAKPLRLRINGGIDFVDDNGVTFGGTPLSFALECAPTQRFSVFGEVAGRAGAPDCFGSACAYGDLRFALGGHLRVTEVLVLDGAVGYSALAENAVGSVGLTSSFGRVE